MKISNIAFVSIMFTFLCGQGEQQKPQIYAGAQRCKVCHETEEEDW